MTRPATPAFRFAPTLWASLCHLLLMAGAFVLFLGRKPGRFRSEAVMDAVPGFYTHVFNFSLSYLLYAGVGFVWLMMGVPMRFVAWAGAALVVANVGYEFLLPLLNTRDPVDAAYGIAGTLLGFAWLCGKNGVRFTSSNGARCTSRAQRRKKHNKRGQRNGTVGNKALDRLG